jgi:sugar phosphate isomerase/epimerase
MSKPNANFRFPLSIQLTLPDDYDQDTRFQQVLGLLQEYRFDGVELNIIHIDLIDPEQLIDYLRRYDLRMTQFATGAAAKALDLSLSAEDEQVHQRSVEACLEFIDFAGLFKAGVIVGFMKGSAGPDQEFARGRFQKALIQIAPKARQAEVPVLIEATNRYESAVANALKDTAELIKPFAENPFIRLLPDTFHMNIEEKNAPAALERWAELYDSIHLSDNNRFFPGLGALDFEATLSFLRRIDYRGGVAIEGNIETDLIQDIHSTMSFLAPLLKTG